MVQGVHLSVYYQTRQFLKGGSLRGTYAMNEVTRRFFALRFLRLKNQKATAAMRATPAAAATEPPATAAVFDFATGAGVEVADADPTGATFPSAAGVGELDVPDEGAAV